MNRALEGLLSGRSLGGRYGVHEVIGRGGMSLVYRAVDERLGREVALKIVSTPVEHSRDELRERFRREAAAAARIPPHPNVVQVYDYGTDPDLDLDYIVMELFRGSDLKALMREGPVAGDDALRIIREAARGLAAGHRVGIVHRDVKPANIFLTGDEDDVKILDFGIAKALEITADKDLTRTGQLPQSPAYASPEQLAHRRDLTPASDVYQLGLVAYELLAGERPYDDPERELLQQGIPVPVRAKGRWREVPAEVRGVIARALEFQPEHRYADAAALARALSADPEAVSAAVPILEPEDDATLLAEPTLPDAPIPAAGIPDPRPPDPSRASAPAARTGARWGRMPQLVGGGLLALLALLAITRLGDDPEPAVPAEAAEVLDEAELDREFRPLIEEASAGLAEEREEAQGEDAAAVEQVVISLHDAWVQGDLARHLSYYADRVAYYNEPRATVEFIEADRRAALERFDDRNITLGRRAIEILEPGRARVLAEMEWSFRGDGDARQEGSGRQEYVLELRDGDWKIVSERLIEQYR